MEDEGYEVSTEKERLDIAMVHDFLSNRSYWAAGIPLEVVRRSVENSLCFGVYQRGRQVGFARVVTDRATVAYLADVFIVEGHRGKGAGKQLVETIMRHPALQGLRIWLLGTKDAHELYRKHGFAKIVETAAADRFMAILKRDAYNTAKEAKG